MRTTLARMRELERTTAGAMAEPLAGTESASATVGREFCTTFCNVDRGFCKFAPVALPSSIYILLHALTKLPHFRICSSCSDPASATIPSSVPLLAALRVTCPLPALPSLPPYHWPLVPTPSPSSPTALSHTSLYNLHWLLVPPSSPTALSHTAPYNLH